MFNVKKLQDNVKEYNQRIEEEQIARVEEWIDRVYAECVEQSKLGRTNHIVEPMDTVKDTKLAIETLIQKYHCNPKYTLELASGKVQISWS